MADITVTAAKVKPLPGALCRDFLAGAAGSVGDVVYIDGDGKVQPTDADAAGTSLGYGIVVASGGEGATAFALNDAVSVCYHGPVVGFSGMTPGARHYVSGTKGKVADAVGANPYTLGVALSATILHVSQGF